MNLFFLFLCLCLFFIIMNSSSRAFSLCFCAADEDIKIAPNHPSDILRDNGSVGEEAANEYTMHSSKGNIEKARSIGATLGERLLSIDCGLTQDVLEDRILFAFAVNQCTEKFSPDSTISHTILGAFYNHIRVKDSEILEQISDSAAFSLYILADRGDRKQTTGQVFATLCGEPENEELARKGQAIYDNYFSACKDYFDQVIFE